MGCMYVDMNKGYTFQTRIYPPMEEHIMQIYTKNRRVIDSMLCDDMQRQLAFVVYYLSS